MAAFLLHSALITDNSVPDHNNSLTAGTDGPILMQDYFLLEKLAHFDRERIPERVVHAKVIITNYNNNGLKGRDLYVMQGRCRARILRGDQGCYGVL